jgi:CDP-diacylglycerol pyrophosphatase
MGATKSICTPPSKPPGVGFIAENGGGGWNEVEEGHENDRGAMPQGSAMKRAVIFLVVAGVFAVTAFVTSAIGLDRLALRQVVRACVADFKLTGAPFPCLEVDLSSGEERGDVVLRPPLLNELIVAPTRESIGLEDPFLQSARAPNYFDAAWRARSFLSGADGRAPERDEIALVANSAVARTQDQLHIHVGCLRPHARLMLAAAAPNVPIGKWVRIGAVVPHTMFWGMRIRGADLSDFEPFRLAVEAFADKVRHRGDLTIAAAGVRIEGDDQFLILASYAEAGGALLPVRSSDLLGESCPAGPSQSA